MASLSHRPAMRRALVHPGPVAEVRVVVVPARLVEHRVGLPAGVPLLPALQAMLDQVGAVGAVGRLVGGSLAAFDYCIPALGQPNGPAATFSERRVGVDPDCGPLALHCGGLTVGRREGRIFAHSHARWQDRARGWLAGHLLPESVILGEGVVAHVVASADVRYEVVQDPETTMQLFMPCEVDRGPGLQVDLSGLMCRVRPNMDLCATIEGLVDEFGWPAASIWGQVGSLVGACLVQPDGSILEVDGPATEVICLDGSVVREHGRARSSLEAEVVDRHGRVHRGVLARGRNLVAMTFELTLQRA